MNFRKILVPVLGGREKDSLVLQTAAVLAKCFNSHLAAIFIRPSPAQALPSIGFGTTRASLEETLAAAMRAADNDAIRAHKAFDSVVIEAGLVRDPRPGAQPRATCDFQIIEGPYANALEFKSRLSDLLVMHPFGKGDPVATHVALETALFTGRPILLAPDAVIPELPRRVMIAFDGSAAAAHAVTSSIPFLRRAGSIEIVRIAEDTKTSPATDSLTDYLAMHGLHTKMRTLEADHRTVSRILFDEAASTGIELLVMGAYGHRRVREVIFGGVTRDAVSSSRNFPILMAH